MHTFESVPSTSKGNDYLCRLLLGQRDRSPKNVNLLKSVPVLIYLSVTLQSPQNAAARDFDAGLAAFPFCIVLASGSPCVKGPI